MTESPTATTAEDYEALRAERDELRALLAAMGPAPSRHRTRTVVSALFVALACLAFLGAMPGLWANRNLLDTDRFVSRVGPLVEEPEVQGVLATRLTEQLLLGVGIVSQVAKLLDPGPALRAAGVGGTVREQIRAALDRSGGAGWVAIGLGLFGAATAGRTLSKTAVAASALAWRLPVRAKAPTRIVGSLVGLLSTMGLVAAVINRVRVELGAPAAGASFAVAVLVYVVAWMFVLALLPRATTDPGAVLPGALLVAGVTALLQLVSQLYLPGKIATPDLYGAGAMVVTLAGCCASRAIVLGMVLNAGSTSGRHDLRAALRSAAARFLPRRYARVRRCFGPDGTDRPPVAAGTGAPLLPGDHPIDDDCRGGGSTMTRTPSRGSAMADVQLPRPIDFVLIEFDVMPC